MNIRGEKRAIRTREPEDIEPLYQWENDYQLWSVSGTTAPFSREVLRNFIVNQKFDIYATRQARFIIATINDSRAIGTIDLFDFEPQHLRAGIGILIYAESDRRMGYATEALQIIERYAIEVLNMHQLYCNIMANNIASLTLFTSAGYNEIGRKPEWNKTQNGWQDEIIFSKILTDTL